MKISIVTVCQNSASTISDTLESVRAQTYPDIEHIVVDGSSTDATMDIVRSHGGESLIAVSERDRGIYDAMNKGIRLAAGEVVGILNADDILASNDTIARIVELFRSCGADADGIYGDVAHVRRDDLSIPTRQTCVRRFSPWQIRFGLMIPHPGFYVRRDLYDRLGLYKLGYRVSADFELMARFVIGGAKLVSHPHIVVKMREGGISTTGLWWRIHQNAEIVRACRENGIYTNLAFVAMKIPSKAIACMRARCGR